jgi:hypothetical protein
MISGQVPVERGPFGAGPMFRGPGYAHAGPAVAGNGNGDKRSVLGKGFHWSGHYPCWAWREKPPPAPPPPELYPGISWHRYARSPRDFFMVEP